MRKNISVTNDTVLKALEESENASKLIERAVLYYLDSIEKEYITRQEVEEMLEDGNKKVCILNKNYTQISDMLDMIIKELSN